MVKAYVASLVFVVLAEMGDKTQLLAMAFATRYRWQTVMSGVLVATLANHLLAVLAGTYLSTVVPLSYVKVAAAGSFILFGLWTLRGDTLQDEDKKFNYSPFWSVAIAFFIAEIGDKTQLATVALATEYRGIVQIWLGTTSGMLIADGVGIVVGVLLGKRIPERLVKWCAASIFIIFGVWGLYEGIPKDIRTPCAVAAVALVLASVIYLMVRKRRVDVNKK